MLSWDETTWMPNQLAGSATTGYITCS